MTLREFLELNTNLSVRFDLMVDDFSEPTVSSLRRSDITDNYLDREVMTFSVFCDPVDNGEFIETFLTFEVVLK